tara:strand:- start:1422 stop:1751 length:330 start_codon:yes stop_codon:yes gene_type:complete
MKKPAIRKNRFKTSNFIEHDWTIKSKNIGEYLFRRISLDQSNKELQDIRPRHILSQLIISSNEITQYVNDYLEMVEMRNQNIKIQSKKQKRRSIQLDKISFSDKQLRKV